MYIDAFIYTLQPEKIQVSIMFLKHLQTHGAPGKGKKAPKIKGTFKRLYTNIFVISID